MVTSGTAGLALGCWLMFSALQHLLIQETDLVLGHSSTEKSSLVVGL